MSDKKDRHAAFLDSLYDSLHEASCENEAELRQSLKEQGFDPDQLVSEGLAIVKQMLGRQKLLQANVRYKRFAQAVAELTSKATSAPRRIREQLAEALTGSSDTAVVQAYFRKLQKISDDDLVTLKDDADILALWEKLEGQADDEQST